MKKITPLESRLQLRVIKDIKEKYSNEVWFYKVNDRVQVGLPDIIMCFFGHFVAIELKRINRKNSIAIKKTPEYLSIDPKDWITQREVEKTMTEKMEKELWEIGGITPKQDYVIHKINYAGGTAFFANSREQVMKKLARIYEKFKN